MFTDVFKMIKTNFFQFILMIISITSLLIVLNFFIFSYKIFDDFSENVKSKLWFYFYIKDTYWSWQRTTPLLLEMISELKDKWIKVKYISKEQALEFFKFNLPEVVNAFKKYWIKNPLPDTVYVNVDNKKQYDIVKDIVSKYKNILLNFEDIWSKETFVKQQQRVKKIINLLNFIKTNIFYFVIVSVFTVVFIILLMVKIDFYQFYKQIEVQKLIWASFLQMKIPFLVKSWILLFFSFVFSFLIELYVILFYKDYIKQIFNVNILQLIKQYNQFIGYVWWMEVVGLYFLVSIFSFILLGYMIRRV